MFKDMAYICENEYNHIFALPNVNGIGIGHKEIGGINTMIPCLKILVIKKIPLENLSSEDVIPNMYKGFSTDVVEVGEIKSFANTSKIRPAQGGYSIGLSSSFASGTLGCLVSTKSGTDLKTFILSNNHVIANNNTAPIGSSILQPSLGDGGVNILDEIATLSDFVPINFSGGNNLVDCAIGLVSNTSLVTNQIANIGSVRGIASAVLGDKVQKSGRTTGYTQGNITSINSTVNVSYGAQNATFIRQLVTTSIAQPGDSGSIVLDMSNRVVGLLFAGSSSATILNDIRYVLKSFKSRLV